MFFLNTIVTIHSRKSRCSESKLPQSIGESIHDYFLRETNSMKMPILMPEQEGICHTIMFNCGEKKASGCPPQRLRGSTALRWHKSHKAVNLHKNEKRIALCTNTKNKS